MTQVVLSYGLGTDSTAVLLRWLEDPDSRDFDLADLLVVTSMTGDEWPLTGELVAEHVLPRLAAAGVRFAQVARRSASQTDGIAVLSDTTNPTELHLAGAYKLSDELREAGTIPQAAGTRRCSLKAKGWVIDTYLELHAPEATRHAFGFEVNEQARADRCTEHMPGHAPPGRLVFGFEVNETARARRATEFDTLYRVAEFPLIEWGWDREACERYIEQVTGVVTWPKSACVYCLAGETDIVTADGIRAIGPLAGGTHRLLVPTQESLGGHMDRGVFRDVEVRSFGQQPLLRVTFSRQRARKVVYATSEHRWILAPASTASQPPDSYRQTTADLRPGDRLRTLTASRASNAQETPWEVVSVEATDRIEEVYCAVVPGVEAFALTDGLMTGNCPFSLTSKAGRARSLLRYDTRPAAALEALMLERRSIALNPRGGLIAGDRLADLIMEHRPLIAAAFDAELDETPHAVYEIRRLWRPRDDNPLKVANASRDLRVLEQGSRAWCERFVRDLGDVETGEDGIERVYRRRRGDTLPTREHFIVAGPAGALAKCMASFEAWWADLDQMTMAL